MTERKIIRNILLGGMVFLLFPLSSVAINDVQFPSDTYFQIFTTDTFILSTVTGVTGGISSHIQVESNYMDVTLDNGSNVTFTVPNDTYFRVTRVSGSGYTISPACLEHTVTLTSTANAVLRIETRSYAIPCGGGGGGGGGGTVLYHMGCFENACIRVAGSGADECSTFLDCLPENSNTNLSPPDNTNSSYGNNNNGQSSNMNGSSNPGNENNNAPFLDIEGHWAEEYINSLNSRCDIEGYKDENGNPLFLFKPDNSISRAELVRILIYCQYGPLSTPDRNPFPDVIRTTWYGPYIDKALELGWINGYKNALGQLTGLFKPNQYINRAEATKIIVLSQFMPEEIIGGMLNFLDTVPGLWYEPYIAFAHDMLFVDGYLNSDGTPTGYFGPQNNITRAETAKIIHNVKGW